MKQNKLFFIISLILVLAAANEGFYIFDLLQQINEGETQSEDSLNVSALHYDWFTRHDDHAFDLFTNFVDMQREMDQLFGQFSHNLEVKPFIESRFGNFKSPPALDFREEDDKYFIEVELPGAGNGSIDVSAEDGILSIQAGTKREDNIDKSNYRRSERYTGSLQRSLTIPSDANFEKMTTKYENGVLSINIPKRM